MAASRASLPVGSAASELPTKPCLDWTRDVIPPEFQLTPWQSFMRDLDWSQSPLGLMASWPFQLRQMVQLITEDPQPAVICWGDLQTIVYNEAYSHIIGQKHPALQGQDPHVVVAKTWDKFDAILREGQRTGKSHIGDNQMVFLTHHGYLEETYYSWKFLPMLGEDSTIIASYAAVMDVTRQTLAQRRNCSIRGLRKLMANTVDLGSFWASLIEGLKSNDKDVPMLMAYSATNQPGSSTFLLEGALGVPENHPAAPDLIDIKGLEGFATPMREALRSKQPLVLNTNDRGFKTRFQQRVFEGIEWRGFGVPSNQLMVIPIRSLAEDTVGFLIIGLNPRNVFDSDYRDYVRRITDSIDPAKVSSILLGESVKWTESQLHSAEFKYQHFADHAPLGVCRMGADGLVKYANDAWYSITGQERKDHDLQAWRKTIHDDDLATMDSFFKNLMISKAPATIESRLKKHWLMNPNNDTDSPPTWILASGYAELHNDGSFNNIVCWVTDISAQKGAAKELKQKMDEALELKHQQENFIDMSMCPSLIISYRQLNSTKVSHEIRNPLSAMLHCSDEITVSLMGSLEALNAIVRTPEAVPLQRHAVRGPISLLETSKDSARTILYCIQHQRRVVDDVLTLSKLDSDLLTVSPCPVQPVKIVREALKIFDGQLRAGDIEFNIQEDPSLQDLDVDWLKFDPGRALQVLMNLFTNAIKFTRTEDVRKIAVRIAASREIPGEDTIRYLPKMERKRPWKDQVTPTDGDQEIMYLSLSVKDTGRGISDEQMKALFQRFSQATPKTYAHYGGSGLGKNFYTNID
jgi:signal transduction histidine kinase